MHPTKLKTKLACILEAGWIHKNCVWEILNLQTTKTIFAGKGDNSLQQKIWFTNSFLCPKPWKFLQQRQAVDKEWETLEKISAWNLTKVRSKKRWSMKARTKGAKVHFASLMDICHLKKCWIGDKAPKNTKGRVVLRGDIVKDDSGVLRSVHWTRITSITNDSSKGHGYHLQTAWVRRSGSRCSICTHPGKNGRCSTIFWKFQNRNVQDIWIRLPRHEWPKSWSSMEDPVVPLERNLYGHPLTGLFMWTAIWENPIEVRLGEGFQLGMLIRTPWKMVLLICVCGWHQIRWKETKHWSDVENTQ